MEIAYFDRGPVNADTLVSGGFWSTYWYDGRIYGTEIARGLDVFALTPSAYLSENEIAAAAISDMGGVFNPQQQFQVSWPAEPVVAHAYIDQLERDGRILPALMADLIQSLDEAELRISNGERDGNLASSLESLTTSLSADGVDAITSRRVHGLIETLQGIAARLR